MNDGWKKRLAVVAALSLLVAGCGMFGEKKPPPPCPPVLILKDAGTLRAYKPGAGRDITDVVFEAKIADFRGLCTYSKDKSEVDIGLSVAFDLTRGPANPDRRATFEYFIAVPKFHPAPAGKKTLSLSTEFAERTSRRRVADEISLKIPFTAGQPLEDYAIYLGFQLTREQLEENQQGGRF